MTDPRRVEHAVARILAETDGPVEVYEATLEAIGRPLGWRLGAVWELDSETARLRCVCTWRAGERTDEFQELSESLTLGPGEGLPGRVLASGEPVWIVDAPEDANFPRAPAARRTGLHAGFGFPLRSARGVVGVMEFFAGDLREPDERLLATMAALGSQVGQFVARRRAEEEVRASESRLRAMLEAALDAVVSMDAQGRVIGWNHAAEAIFGYPASEVIGREMSELIVPPALREAHRRGLSRFLESRRGLVLDRRLELTGMRRDGSEFPVELTITRIALPGPPTFTGYLRDITDRVLADRELRASRARLVEVADAERRRIQRNLHDGAQQRLTSVLLSLGRLRGTEVGARRAARCRDRGARGRPGGAARARERPAPGAAHRARPCDGARGARDARPAPGRARDRARPAAAGADRGGGLLRRRGGARERPEARRRASRQRAGGDRRRAGRRERQRRRRRRGG